ncbi:SSI family serine proteinase inhibitor [Arthrobacter sp. L77]|uniref:SSI family serine proteinase inhibitor n=1 Tax=Arthrobacter sp. L77 TaxID=1496689 RepID=UPI000689618B|nr:SSI family serine proteinase inhibitor [Arthrobacter sp. L77]
MTSTDPTPTAGRARTAARRALIPLAALTLALAACDQGGPAPEPTDQETSVQSSTPTPDDSAAPTPSAPSGPAPSAPPASTAPPAASTNALLTVSVQQDASSDPVQYVLECVDGVSGPASTHPNADAACATVARLGTAFFTARPNKDVVCTQQYGGPQTASITGEIDGTSVVGSFALTDGCQISRWTSVQDLLGAPGAQ